MKPWITRLAVELLREYAERLGNDVCNDYDPPDYVPLDELREIIRDADPENDDVEGLEGYNWAVVEAVADALERNSR